MNTTATAYGAAEQPLTALLDAVPADRWAAPSPCEGWSARDVLRHVVSTQRDFFTRHEVDLGEDPDLVADPAAAWREHAERVAGALADDALPQTAFDGYFGPTTVGATFEQFFVWDMLVHRWDLARAVGADATLSDAELDRVESGADSFGDGLTTEGICRPAVEPPAGADRQAQVLARLGRRA